MKRGYTILISCIIAVTAIAQEYTYFVPSELDSEIKNKKIILLGELDHGDGTSFLAKTELIKHLHENHGYHVLAFEAGMTNCIELWKQIGQTERTDSLFKRHLYYVWSEVEEMKVLFEYLREQKEKGTPLILVGIDPQFSGQGNARVIIDALRSKLPGDVLDTQVFMNFCVELMRMSKWLKYPKKIQHRMTEDEFYHYADSLEKLIVKQIGEEEEFLWRRCFENLKVNARIKWEKRADGFATRDFQMFRNLEYWQEKHGKVIVWAANAHIIRKDIKLKGKNHDHPLIGIKKLGDYVNDTYRSKAYSIAISAGRGETLDWPWSKRKNRIRRHHERTLEGILTKGESGFVDLSTFEKINKLDQYDAQLFYPNVLCTAKWSNHFDAVLFIPEMQASTACWIGKK